MRSRLSRLRGDNIKQFRVMLPGVSDDVVEAEYWFVHESGSLIFANANAYGQYYQKAYAAGFWLKVEELEPKS